MDPLPRGARPLSLGTKRVPEADWIEVGGDDWDPLLALKADVLSHHWDDCVSLGPGSEPAQRELLELVLAHLADRGIVAPTAGPEGDGAEPAIVRAGRLVPDDLCLLDADDHRLTAGVVTFPNRWRVPDKVGLSPLHVHGPVAGYPASLGHPVDKVLRALRPGRVLERHNWALLDDPTLFQPGAGSPASTPPPVPDGLWLRGERQSLRRLPATGAVVFTIRTRQWPLAALADEPDQRARLAEALASLPDDLADYKGVLTLRPSVLAWLREEG